MDSSFFQETCPPCQCWTVPRSYRVRPEGRHEVLPEILAVKRGLLIRREHLLTVVLHYLAPLIPFLFRRGGHRWVWVTPSVWVRVQILPYRQVPHPRGLICEIYSGRGRAWHAWTVGCLFLFSVTIRRVRCFRIVSGTLLLVRRGRVWKPDSGCVWGRRVRRWNTL